MNINWIEIQHILQSINYYCPPSKATYVLTLHSEEDILFNDLDEIIDNYTYFIHKK